MVLLLFFQPLLESLQSFIAPEAEDINELIYIRPHPTPRYDGSGDPGFCIIKDVRIGFPILQRILLMGFGIHDHLLHHVVLTFNVHVDRDLKLLQVWYRNDRELLGGFIFVDKKERIAWLHKYAVPAQGIRNRKHTPGTDYPHIFHPVDLAFIQYGTTNGKLCPCLRAADTKDKKE